jgi:perosamine synthetase
MRKIHIEDMRIESSATIRQAMQAIGAGGYSAAVVFEEVNHTMFQRILTDGDIRRALLNGHGLEAGINVIPLAQQIRATPETSSEEISKLFNERVRLVPVVDEDNRLVDLYFFDKRTHIAVATPLFDDEEIALVNECIVSGWVSSGGPFVTQFEAMMAEQCGVQHAIACSSATTGLHLILLGYGIGLGDEVIVPSLSFIATANAVTYTGAKPVFVDSDSATWNIDPDKIEAAITDRSKAIIPVHLYGLPVEMDSVNFIARRHGLIVVEDAAEAHGAVYKGQPVGGLGDAAVFSFFGNKIITTGEGGMIVTNNREVAERCRMLRDHGMSKKKRYWHEVVGYNYRMTNIQAAVGVAQMKKIDRILSRMKEIARQYKSYLQGLHGVSLPTEVDQVENVYWLYTILVDQQQTGLDAGELIEMLKGHGIDSRPIFPPMHMQPIYNNGLELPVAERISAMGISLPSSPEIRDDEIEHICRFITSLLC